MKISARGRIAQVCEDCGAIHNRRSVLCNDCAMKRNRESTRLARLRMDGVVKPHHCTVCDAQLLKADPTGMCGFCKYELGEAA